MVGHCKSTDLTMCQECTCNVTRDITCSMKTIESELVELQGLVDNTGNLTHFETFNKKKNLLAELLDTVTQGALRLKVQSILIDFFFF